MPARSEDRRCPTTTPEREMQNNQRWLLVKYICFRIQRRLSSGMRIHPMQTYLPGTVNIDATLVQNGTATFTLDDAYYDLVYSVEESTDGSRRGSNHWL